VEDKGGVTNAALLKEGGSSFNFPVAAGVVMG